MRVFWRNRSIAYCLVLAIATVMLTFDYAGASVRYRLGAGDEINLTTVTKINQGAGSGLDADKLDGLLFVQGVEIPEPPELYVTVASFSW